MTSVECCIILCLAFLNLIHTTQSPPSIFTTFPKKQPDKQQKWQDTKAENLKILMFFLRIMVVLGDMVSSRTNESTIINQLKHSRMLYKPCLQTKNWWLFLRNQLCTRRNKVSQKLLT